MTTIHLHDHERRRFLAKQDAYLSVAISHSAATYATLYSHMLKCKDGCSKSLFEWPLTKCPSSLHLWDEFDLAISREHDIRNRLITTRRATPTAAPLSR